MTDATGTSTWTRDAWGRATSSAQPLTGRTIQYTFNAAGQRAAVTLSGAGDPRTITYTYDQASRLRTLADSAVNAQPFIYGYDPGTNWTATLTTPTGSTTRRERDTLGRVKEARFHRSGGQPLSDFAYTYDAAGQRTAESGPRGNIAFGYNSRSELTTASGHTAGPFAYAYDPIGTTGGWGASGEIPLPRNPEREMSGSERVNCSRLSATQAAASLTYTPNALNQYTRIEQSGTAFTPVHDPNGNQTHLRTASGTFTATYDNEDRLTTLISATNPQQSTTFRYDGLSRRVETREQQNGAITKTIRYVYDGLLPIEEHEWSGPATGTPQSIRHLTRGPDLSGTFEGAGGIGGLVAFTENAASSSKLTRSAPLRNSAQWANPAGLSVSHLPCGARLADANGNITALYNTSDATTATYTYDPFGRLVNATGPLATRNTYQWSSKEHHAPTGLVYYLYRLYNPEAGRWVNRDPIAEAGGSNIYSAYLNGPSIALDGFGLACIKSIFVEFSSAERTIGPPQVIPDPVQGYNYVTGRIYKGRLSIMFDDGSIFGWEVKSGGYRMKGSAVRGPSEAADPSTGDDAATPAGDWKVNTLQNTWGLRGFTIAVGGGRSAILIHQTRGFGTHGCIGLSPTDFEAFVSYMNDTRSCCQRRLVTMYVRYHLEPEDQPKGNAGNGRNSPTHPFPPGWPEPDPGPLPPSWLSR